jgi:hypothetical protein
MNPYLKKNKLFETYFLFFLNFNQFQLSRLRSTIYLKFFLVYFHIFLTKLIIKKSSKGVVTSPIKCHGFFIWRFFSAQTIPLKLCFAKTINIEIKTNKKGDFKKEYESINFSNRSFLFSVLKSSQIQYTQVTLVFFRGPFYSWT